MSKIERVFFLFLFSIIITENFANNQGNRKSVNSFIVTRLLWGIGERCHVGVSEIPRGSSTYLVRPDCKASLNSKIKPK